MIRVLLADDHAMFREGLCALLGKQSDVEVVGEAENGRELVRLAKRLSPDVAVVDIAMPVLGGIEAIQRMRREMPAIRTIVLSMHRATEHVLGALRAGASGYLLKQSVSAELMEAIHAVHAGRRYLSQRVSEVVVDYHMDERGAGEPGAASPLEALSVREREVLQFVVAGKTSVEIGKVLHLSAKTIDSYRSRLMHKLGARNTPDLVRMAMERGWSADM